MIEPLHVCHVGPYPRRGGGISTVTASIIERQRLDPELSIELLPTSVDGSRAAKLAALLVALLRLELRCRRLPAPLLHVHASSGMSFRRKRHVLRIAARHRLATVLHVHSGRIRRWYDDGSERHRRWVRRGFELAGHVVALSDSWKQCLQPLTSRPITVISNAVDPTSFAVERDYAFSGEIRLLLLGGGDLMGKGAAEAIDALSSLSVDDLPAPLRLILVGHGDADRVRRLAAERGLTTGVDVTGWVENEVARRLLGEADIFLLPSHAEGLPLSMLEAMASGLPVVVTPVGGIPEVIEDGRNGLLVRPGDPEDLSRAVRRLIKDEDLRRRLGASARETAVERFDIRVAASRLKSVYLDTIDAAGGSATE